MTVSSEVSVAGPFYGNGTTTTFPYSFKILDAKHIRAVLISASGDVSDLSLDNGDYNVTGVGSETGGDVIKTTPLLAGQTLTLVRRLPLTQETSLENQGAYYPEVVERRLDQMVMQIQSVKETTERSLTVEPGQEKPSMTQIAAAQGYSQAAKTSRDEAAGLASAAAGSASNASGYAVLASRWASEAENVPVAGGLFSAFHWYRKAYAVYQTVTQGFLEKVGGILTGDVLFGPGTGGKYSKLQANGDVQLNRGDNTGFATWNVNNAYFGWDGTRYVFGPAGSVALTGPELRMDYDGANASYYATGDIRFGSYMATEFGVGLSAALRAAKGGLGVGQIWQDVMSARSAGTIYQNTSGKPIMVAPQGWARYSFCEGQVSADNSNWITPPRPEKIVNSDTTYYFAYPMFVVPPGHYYRLTQGSSFLGTQAWLELR
ncbi:hypothetical protein EYC79_13495 [Agrobacterium cavarae]|uniref:Uncharacterized protein n=1 Tax=Agrobacterium cavarae TaxID=2528239 RepID=A0ABY1Y6E4_9HYPH|nr:hypothetical protein [Agrobacterium cavarae]TBN11287.1 hypothetical protein EYC79_13495 [Agrobacterium cavarae]